MPWLRDIPLFNVRRFDDANLLAMSLVEDLGLDRLEVIDISISIEDRFGIEIETEHYEALRTIGDLAALIERRNRKADRYYSNPLWGGYLA